MSKKTKKRRRKTPAVVYVLLFLCVLVIAAIIYFAVGMFSSREKAEDSSVKSVSSSVSEISSDDTSEDDSDVYVVPTVTPEPEPTDIPADELADVTEEDISSEYAYMMRAGDDAVILDKNGTVKMYPASMTKVMTALVAIENLPDLDEKLVITQDVIDAAYLADASCAGFAVGESVTVRDLLYGVLLPSGADACLTLANEISGSEANFAELMNQKAEELGLTGTHFVNSTGLHDENHYSTCADIARIFEEAIGNDIFYEIITTPSYECEPNEFHENGLVLYSVLFNDLKENVLDNGAVVLGGKTGYTDDAGSCLVSFASYGDGIFILATGMAHTDVDGVNGRIKDIQAAYGSLH